MDLEFHVYKPVLVGSFWKHFAQCSAQSFIQPKALSKCVKADETEKQLKNSPITCAGLVKNLNYE